MKTMNAEMNEIHFRHSSNKFTSAYLNSLPTMSDIQFEIATLTRLGAPLIAGTCHCQNCNRNNENIVLDGLYGVSHSNNINHARNNNHNRLQRALYSFIKKLAPGIMIQNNPLLIQSLERKNPESTEALTKLYGDLKVTSDSLDAVIDVRIGSSLKPKLNDNSLRNIFDIANQAEDNKRAEYNQYKTDANNFFPFAFDIFGVPSNSASTLMNNLTDEAMKYNTHLPRSIITSIFRQQISVAMHINIANSTMIMINNCDPNIPCNNNIILTNTGRSIRI